MFIGLVAALFCACDAKASGTESIVAFAFSLPSENATIAYEIFTDVEGVVSTIVRYEAQSDIDTPRRSDLREGYVKTDEYSVQRDGGTIKIVRADGVGEQPGVSLIETSETAVRLVVDRSTRLEAIIVFDHDAETARTTYRGRLMNTFVQNGTTALLSNPNERITYTFAEQRLQSMVSTSDSSGDTVALDVHFDPPDRYDIVMPSGDDPVPYLRRVVVYGSPRAVTLRSMVYNFYLLDVLDGDRRSYILPFVGSPIKIQND